MTSTRRWTKDEIAEVERLTNIGETMQQIADKLGASLHQVSYLRQKLDIIKERQDPVYVTTVADERLRKRWVSLLPELKANLLRDIAKNA